MLPKRRLASKAEQKVYFRDMLEGSKSWLHTTSAIHFLHPALHRRWERMPSLPQNPKGAGRRERETFILRGVRCWFAKQTFGSTFSEASVFEELPYLTCFRKQHKSKRKAGWSCVALSVNTLILFLEYNWKGWKSICTAVSPSFTCPGLSEGTAVSSVQDRVKTPQASASSSVTHCEEYRSTSTLHLHLCPCSLFVCCN